MRTASDPLRASRKRIVELRNLGNVDLDRLGRLPAQVLYGVAYYAEYQPYDRLERDLPQLRTAYAGASPFPHVVLEAMALGLPVLALPVTAAYAAVPPEAGVLSADPDELAAVARRWLADPSEAAAYGKAAREHVLAHYPLDLFLGVPGAVVLQHVDLVHLQTA